MAMKKPEVDRNRLAIRESLKPYEIVVYDKDGEVMASSSELLSYNDWKQVYTHACVINLMRFKNARWITINGRDGEPIDVLG